MYTTISDQSKWVFEVQMSAQIQVTKQASKITNRARQSAYETMDAATERTLKSAYEASKRARALLESMES